MIILILGIGILVSPFILKMFYLIKAKIVKDPLVEARTKFEEIICKDISFNIENVTCIKTEGNLVELTFALVNNGATIENIDVSHDPVIRKDSDFVITSFFGINKTKINAGETKIIGPLIAASYNLLPDKEKYMYVVPMIKYDDEVGEEICSRSHIKAKFECV